MLFVLCGIISCNCSKMLPLLRELAPSFLPFLLFIGPPAAQPSSPSSVLLSNSRLSLIFSCSSHPPPTQMPFPSNIHLFFSLLPYTIHAFFQHSASVIRHLPLSIPSPFISMIISSPDKLIGCPWRLLCCLTHHDSDCVRVCVQAWVCMHVRSFHSM